MKRYVGLVMLVMLCSCATLRALITDAEEQCETSTVKLGGVPVADVCKDAEPLVREALAGMTEADLAREPAGDMPLTVHGKHRGTVDARVWKRVQTHADTAAK